MRRPFYPPWRVKGGPRLNRSSATNFLSFSLKLKENSKVGIITKPAVAKGRWNEPCEIMEYTHLIYHELCRNPGLVSWSGVVGFVDCGVCWAPAREAGVAYYVLCDHLLLPSLHLSPMSLSFSDSCSREPFATVTKKSTLISSPGGRALGFGSGGQFPLKPKIQGISSFKYKNTKQIDRSTFFVFRLFIYHVTTYRYAYLKTSLP